MLSAFIGSAAITLTCCILQHFLEHSSYSAMLIRDASKRVCVVAALKAAILGFSDQQVVTGISVLVAGYFQLPHGIASYHWKIVSNMAWFSTITHLATLTSLRAQALQNGTLKWVRIISMGALLSLLLPVMGSTGYLDRRHIFPEDGRSQKATGNLPAWCLFHPKMSWGSPNDLPVSRAYNWVYMTFAILLLLYGYVTRVYMLCRIGHRKLFLERLHVPVDWPWKSIEAWIQWSRGYSGNFSNPIIRPLYKLLRSSYAVLQAFNCIYGSSLWEVHVFLCQLPTHVDVSSLPGWLLLSCGVLCKLSSRSRSSPIPAEAYATVPRISLISSGVLDKYYRSPSWHCRSLASFVIHTCGNDT